VTDAAVLSTIASGAIVVVRHGKTKTDQLGRAIDALRSVDAHIYGLIFTMTPTKGPDAYYYSGAGYRYDPKQAKSGTVTPRSREGRRRASDDRGNAAASATRAFGSTVLPEGTSHPAPTTLAPARPASSRDNGNENESDPLNFFGS
jgi:hypothetical protein